MILSILFFKDEILNLLGWVPKPFMCIYIKASGVIQTVRYNKAQVSRNYFHTLTFSPIYFNQ